MRVLIIGGAGFVGSHVADRLAADGHDVLLLGALLPQAHGTGDRAPRAGARPARHVVQVLLALPSRSTLRAATRLHAALQPAGNEDAREP